MIHGGQINVDNLHSFPIKLSVNAVCLLRELQREGFVITLLETIVPKETVYFLAEKEHTKVVVASMHGLMHVTLNSRLGHYLTTNKHKTYAYLQHEGIQVPDFSYEVSDIETLLQKYQKLVVKPKSGTKGIDVRTNLTSLDQVTAAVQQITEKSGEPIIQQQVEGDDYRLLFIDYAFVGALQRVPASVVGDGKQTVGQLIDAWNEQKKQKTQTFGNSFGYIDPELAAKTYGQELLGKVPEANERVQVCNIANLSLGGQSIAVTEKVNNELILQLEAVLRVYGLGLCGVDVISSDIGAAPSEGKSYVIELNATPGLWAHVYPDEGNSVDVFKLTLEAVINKR